jgi:regulatory protein
MNHRITALTQQKHNPQRVNVFLDGEFAFGLARIVGAWLQVGQEISDEKIALLQAEDAREVAYQRAIKLLHYRPHTEAEVRQSLRGHAVDETIIDAVIERLKSSALIDDARFAQLWVENRAEMRPRSQRALAFELNKRGVQSAEIELALEAVDDEEMAYQAARKQARKLKDHEWKVFRHKLYSFLSLRGFNYQISSQIIPRVWDEIHDPDRLTDEEANL